MQNFIKHFHRDPLGVWICTIAADMTLPEGRIQVPVGSRFAPGTKFMNVDLAAVLEREYQRQQGQPA
jgi:hypothetical protein